MIEQAMFVGIGFLLASLLAIVFMPLVHGRAVRLTMRRLEAATPLSMAEIQADKDQLRAEFAMSTRRLEMSVEQMKAKTTSQLAELGKKTDAINKLKAELGEKASTIFALEAREKAIREQLRTMEEEYAVKTTSLRECERALIDKEADLAKLQAELGERTALADSRHVEVVSLKSQIEALKSRIADYENEIRKSEDKIDVQRNAAKAASKELSDERGKVENLGSRVAQLEQQLVAQTTEAEIMSKRAQELESRITDQTKLLTEREYDLDKLRSQLEAARQTEADLRTELANADERQKKAVENLRSEKGLLDKQIERLNEERSKLQGEIAAMKREAESTWAAERVENALLRERINDVAAEVARLTAVLEGPNSPIDAILAGEKVPAIGTVHEIETDGQGAPIKASNGAEAKGNLAERMRALQSHASRLPDSSQPS
jgi:chromosome segregation ATPase